MFSVNSLRCSSWRISSASSGVAPRVTRNRDNAARASAKVCRRPLCADMTQPAGERDGMKADRELRYPCPTKRPGGKKCGRSEEHTSELQSLMRISYAVFCLKKKKDHIHMVQLQQSN